MKGFSMLKVKFCTFFFLNNFPHGFILLACLGYGDAKSYKGDGKSVLLNLELNKLPSDPNKDLSLSLSLMFCFFCTDNGLSIMSLLPDLFALIFKNSLYLGKFFYLDFRVGLRIKLWC